MFDPADDLSSDELEDVLGSDEPKRKPQERRQRAPEAQGARYDPLVGASIGELWRRNQQPIDAVPTPYPTWNRVCGGKGGREGIARGWNVIFGAPPGTMKSILACNMAVHAALCGETVVFHSLEMDWDDNAIRTLAIASGQPVWKLEPGKSFDRAAAKRAEDTMERIRRESGGVVWVNKDSIRNLSQLKDSVHRWTEKGGRFHIFDYLQLVGVGSGQWNDILARVTETSYEVRMMTKELQIASVGLSQLIRDAIRSKDRPEAQDLMGGSPLENDAHQIYIFDPTRYRRDEYGWRGWLANVKNRHGDKGEDADIPIHFNRSTLVVRERRPDEVNGDEREQTIVTKRRNG